jgi:hypothetical protein
MAEGGNGARFRFLKGGYQAAGKTGVGAVTSSAGISGKNRRVAFAAGCTKALFPYREQVTVPVRDERVQGDDEAGRETGRWTKG